MSYDAKKLCQRYGLTHVEASELALRRHRCGKGFKYLDLDGKTVSDKSIKARIKGLVIPPAWTEVCIAEDPRAHIQAIGRDADGRLQYRYHSDWDSARAERKEGRLRKFGKALPRVRTAVKKALASPRLSRDKVIAAVVRLIDRAVLRPGYDEYARKDGGRGAATLLKSDVEVEGDTVKLAFYGKSGKEIRREIKDALLAGVVKQLRKSKSRRLFTVPGEKGGERPVSAREVNEFLAENAGAEVSAKDFRTFRASAGALAYLTENNGHETERLRKKALVAAADLASQELANTRAVARSSYIHPSVIKAYETGRLEASLLKGRVRNGLNKVESALMRFLEKSRQSAPRT